jgi:hypothetical protein
MPAPQPCTRVSVTMPDRVGTEMIGEAQEGLEHATSGQALHFPAAGLKALQRSPHDSWKASLTLEAQAFARIR